MIYLVTYDIGDDVRRQAVGALLSAYGARVQLSVFECDFADADHFAGVRARIDGLIEPVEDQVRFYPLPANALRDLLVIGSRTLEERADFWIV